MRENELSLYRTAAPEPEPGDGPERYCVAPGVYIVAGTPRTIEPHTISADGMLQAVDEAARIVFGHGHRAALESVTRIRAGSLNQWGRRSQIPPPRLVAWLAWVSSMPNPEATGLALRLVQLRRGPSEAHVDVSRADHLIFEARK